MKYIIDFVRKWGEEAFFCASKKAPSDVQRTLESIGAKPEFLVLPDAKSKIKVWAIKIYYMMRLYSKLKPNDELFFQGYGFERSVAILVRLARRKNIKSHYIVHDINFLRYDEFYSDKKEVEFLKLFDCLYVHTENMVKHLHRLGISTPMKIMHIFDYYSDDPVMAKEETFALKNVVAFAGNLDKSVFLAKLVNTEIPSNITYRLYGISQDASKLENSQIKYMGAFQPNRTGALKAGWGLLWDGDSVETCSGDLGLYLKVNASHKLSLYLACGMPVIVWKESSLAEWLTQKGVCITINSLKEIPEAISNLSDNQYSKMIDNSIKLSVQLRKGELLKALLLSEEPINGGVI